MMPRIEQVCHRVAPCILDCKQVCKSCIQYIALVLFDRAVRIAFVNAVQILVALMAGAVNTQTWALMFASLV